MSLVLAGEEARGRGRKGGRGASGIRSPVVLNAFVTCTFPVVHTNLDLESFKECSCLACVAVKNKMTQLAPKILTIREKK